MWSAADRAMGEWLEKERQKLQIPDDPLSRAPATCFMLVMGHYKAITLLLGANMGLATYPLVRALHEAFVRGVWLMTFGTREHAEQVLSPSFPPGQLIKSERMARQLAKDLGPHGNAISNFHDQNWPVLSEMVHARGRALYTWQQKGILTVSLPDSELLKVRLFAMRRAIQAGGLLARLAHNAEVETSHLDMLEKITEDGSATASDTK